VYIFVDESGTFTSTKLSDAWCVVAAYVSPESNRAALTKLITRLRFECSNGSETKLRDMSERRYLRFLDDLRQLKGLAFAVAVDMSLNNGAAVALHRDTQAEKVVEHREKMIHESGKRAVTRLSELIQALPIQLYIQLVCQLELFHKVLTRAPLYYAQRHPAALAHLRWRVDRKNTVPTAYEEAFRTVLPAILQTMSLSDPMIMLEGADYSHFKRFDFPPGGEPDHLRTVYGIDSRGGADVGKMIREDFQFVDSNLVPGVQVADLLSAGLRRLLRGQFNAPAIVATLLGANMLQELKGLPLVQLISLDQSGNTSQRTASLLRSMASRSHRMLAQ
jgi:hypothetical protein